MQLFPYLVRDCIIVTSVIVRADVYKLSDLCAHHMVSQHNDNSKLHHNQVRLKQAH
jgi:hypothetical protein